MRPAGGAIAFRKNVIPLKVNGLERYVLKVRWDLLEGARRVPPNFESNGCTLAPDSIRWAFGQYKLWPACHIHDWDYAVGGTEADRRSADARLRRNLKVLLRSQGAPLWLVLRVGWTYWYAVRKFGADHFNYEEAR